LALTPGIRLGVYEIIEPIGEGGMGEVYRARDTKLQRDVAIKVLPELFAQDPDRLTRFEREARTLAALSHPNIAAIYGIEEWASMRALVMELVEGDDLSVFVARGRLPLAEALPIARQIADALEAAHDLGIVHRDLKPGNVRVRADGTVKVLDFGLAKGFASDGPSAADAMHSPTLTARATQMGMIIGTAAYMSPEQARGKAVDRRADIWAFGVVLYELLTGERAFKGDEISDVLAAVLRQDVDWMALPTSTPAPVRRLLERCLERDPKTRLRDIGEARIVLANPAAPAAVDAASAPQASGIRRLLPWVTTVLLAVVAAVASWGWLHPPAAPRRTVTRAAMILSSSIERANDVALSRDGTRLAYWELSGGQGHIVLRMMDQLDGKPIPGTEGGDWPVFSPDGQWIAFLSGTSSSIKIKKIPVTGGTPVTVCDAGSMDSVFPTISWDNDETIVFGSDTGLMRVSAAGGKPQALTTIDTKAGDTGHLFAQVLPGGQALLFTIVGTSPATSRIAALDLETHVYRVLVNGAEAGRYVPTGHLVYQRGDALFAAPFDIRRRAVTGSEMPVVEGVSHFDYTFSQTGLLVFTPGSSSGSSQLVNTTLEWTDRKGVAQPVPAPARAWASLAVSPDGKLVAGTIQVSPSDQSGGSNIWKYDIERTTLTKMTFDGSNNSPVWTRDGQSIAYSSTRDGKTAIYRMSVNASGPPELLLSAEPGFSAWPSSWAPDGALLYTTREQTGTTRMQIWILPAPGSGGQTRPLLETAFDAYDPHVSPDGKSVAYMSYESGQSEIYVVPFPRDVARGRSGPGGKVQISTHGGVSPKWSADGRELFYIQGNTTRASLRQLMAADMQAAPPGRPRPLFTLPGSSFDVTPDPQRFLVARLPEAAKGTANTFIVITDWFDDLLRRAPIHKQ